MAIKIERRQTGIAGSGGLPGGSFGGGDVGSGLMRAGMSLLRQSQARNAANQSIADQLRGRQDAMARPVQNDDGSFNAPPAFDWNQTDDYNRGFVSGTLERRFDVFQNTALNRINQIQSDPNLNAAEKQMQLQQFGQSYLDQLQVHEAERGRFGNWLETTIQTTSRQLVEQENRQLFKLKVEGAESRIKRRTDEMTAAIASGDTKMVSIIQESIDNDFEFLQSALAISPDKRKVAQTQLYELARVTGMSRQVGTALATMEVDPGKVDAFLDAIKTGSDYKLEWTGRDGRRWEIDTKKLDVADEGLRNQLIQNLNGTQTRMQKVWNDMAENEAFLEFMQNKDPSVQLSPEQTKTFNSQLDQIMQANGIDKPQTWDMVTYWSARAGAVPSNAVDSLVSMVQSGDENQIALAAQAWNNIRAAQDGKTGKFIGNALAASVPDDKARVLNAIADWSSLGFTPQQIAVARDKMFSGDKTFNETTGDALKAWGQVATADDNLEKSFDTEILNRWQAAAPGTSFGINMTPLGPNPANLWTSSTPSPRMPPWWGDAVKQAYTVNFMINPSDPKAALDMAVKQVESQTIRSPIFKDGAARVADGNFQNLQKPGWLELGKDVIKGLTTNRGDGYDQLEQFVLSEIGLDETDPLSPDIPMIEVNDLMRVTRDGTPKLGENLTLHRIGGDYQNPQFEVWFKGNDGFYLPLKSADGGNLLIQPAGEWRMREARMAFDQKVAGLNEAQADEIDAAQKQRDQIFQERVNEYIRLNPGTLPGKEQVKLFDEQALEGFDVEKEAIEQGYRKLRDELELSAPVPEVTPKTGLPEQPVVDRVRSVVSGNGEEAVAPYQPTGTPTINSNETGPWQGKAPDIKSFLVPGKDESHANLSKDLSDPLARLLADARAAGHDVQIFSGYRSPEHQEQLWQAALKKYGSPAAARKHVAPPGRSMHNKGGAADLTYGGSHKNVFARKPEQMKPEQRAAMEWVHANAGKYGLHFRMDHEPWHIERNGQPIPTQQASAASLSAGGGDTYSSLVVPRSQGKAVVVTAARAIDAILPDGTGGSFLVNIASTESNFGKAGGTFRLKGDRGIWQINPGGAFAEVHRQLGLPGSKVAKAAAKLKEAYGLDVGKATFADMDKPLHSAAFARLYMIARGKEQIPTDVNAQAGIWKKYYNTVLGAGKPEHFISKAVPMPVREAANERAVSFKEVGQVEKSLFDSAVSAVTNYFRGAPQEEALPPLDPTNIMVSRRIPDMKNLEIFEDVNRIVHKTTRDDAEYKKNMDIAVEELTDGFAFTGDQKLMFRDLLEFARTQPLLYRAFENSKGKRVLFYDMVHAGPVKGQGLLRYARTANNTRAYGYYDHGAEFLVVPMPQRAGIDADTVAVTGFQDAMETLGHEIMHTTFNRKAIMQNDRLSTADQLRFINPDYEHAMIYAVMAQYKSQSKETLQLNQTRAQRHLDAYNDQNGTEYTIEDLLEDSKVLAGAFSQ